MYIFFSRALRSFSNESDNFYATTGVSIVESGTGLGSGGGFVINDDGGNPTSYLRNNLIGYFNILENCKHHKINNLIFASSSSVYGGNKQLPFKEKDGANHPISLYAATKKSNELMAHAYSHLYNLPCIVDNILLVLSILFLFYYYYKVKFL